MQLWQDALIALLAAIGLASLIWLFVRTLLFRPVISHSALVLLCARGDGQELEQQVRALVMLRRERGIVGEILVVDCGLSEEGRHLCYLLARQEHSVTLCHCEEIENYLGRF